MIDGFSAGGCQPPLRRTGVVLSRCQQQMHDATKGTHVPYYTTTEGGLSATPTTNARYRTHQKQMKLYGEQAE
jgi:hypothetical protein